MELFLAVLLVVTAPKDEGTTAQAFEARQLFGAALKSYQKGDFLAASSSCERALELDPEYASAAQLGAFCAWQQKDSSRATRLLTQAFRHRPEDPLLALNLARAHKQEEEWAQALDLLERAEKLSPGKELAVWREQAEVLVRSGSPARAEPVLRKILEAVPLDLPARQLLADVYAVTGRSAEALALLRELVRESENPSAELKMVHLLLNQGALEEAAQELESCVQRDPDNRAFRSVLVQLYGGPRPDPVRRRVHEARLKELEARGR